MQRLASLLAYFNGRGSDQCRRRLSALVAGLRAGRPQPVVAAEAEVGCPRALVRELVDALGSNAEIVGIAHCVTQQVVQTFC